MAREDTPGACRLFLLQRNLFLPVSHLLVPLLPTSPDKTLLSLSVCITRITSGSFIIRGRG